MRVQVTLDMYDGTQGKSIIMDAEDMPVRDLIFKMMASEVCGFTVTKFDNPVRLVKKLDAINK